MTTGKHQAQTVIDDILVLRIIRRLRFQFGRQYRSRCIEPRVPPHAIDRLESPGTHQPGSRVRGNAVPLPLRQRGDKGIVQGLFGQVEVAVQQAYQRRQHKASFVLVELVYALLNDCLVHPGSVLYRFGSSARYKVGQELTNGKVGRKTRKKRPANAGLKSASMLSVTDPRSNDHGRSGY
jgi:hypothetical protein